jgi:cell wall-associated NlpC family hydrolase
VPSRTPSLDRPRPDTRRGRRTVVIAVAGVALAAGLLGPPAVSAFGESVPAARVDTPSVLADALSAAPDAPADVAAEAPPSVEHELPAGWTVAREAEPARSVVVDEDGGWVATFTDDARTVALAGPERRFEEPSATHGVTTDAWVRVLDEPFDGEVDAAWLAAAVEDDAADVLEVLTEYWDGAPEVVGDDGVVVSGEAGYGPKRRDGSRSIGADWHDYQGVEGVYPTRIDQPDPARYRKLDCSGYVRKVYGMRFGVPMTRRPDGGESLPRRSMQQAAEAPGVAPIVDTGETVPADELDRLQAGDLVLFDAPSDDDEVIDHVGLYLGVDDAGHHRFVHSRPSSNGPTMGGDSYGASVVDHGFYGDGFRSSRRL